MSPLIQILMALASVGVLIAMLKTVQMIANGYGINAELQRKLVHIGTGLYALILPWIFPDRWPVYLIVGLAMIVMLILRLPNSHLGSTLHSVDRKSYGDLLLAASIGLCLFMAQDELFLYVLPIAVLTLGDAAAALAGSKYGTRFFLVEEGQKSFEGSAVFFLITLLISVFCLLLMTPLAPLNIIVLSFMVAGFGTVVEATSWRGFDNLFLPMGLLIFLQIHATSPIENLILLAILFASSTLAFKLISPRLGLSDHAASVYVTSVFLLLAATEFQNAFFPILVLAAHAWSRSFAPCKSDHPDLDIVAGLAMVSFVSLAVGNGSQWNAISFYGITAMGMTTGLCTLALSPLSSAVKSTTLVAIIAACFAIRSFILPLNNDLANWNGPMWPQVTATLALVILATLIMPRLFDHRRAVKLTLLSFTVPAATYLHATNFVGGFA